MKTVLIAVLAVLLIASPVYAGMLDNGADQWDSKYFKQGTLAGPYGSRQIDKDGLDCTPTDVKVAVTMAYLFLVAGIVAPPIVIGHYAAHRTMVPAGIKFVGRGESRHAVALFKVLSHKAPEYLTQWAWAGPGLAGSLAAAEGLSYTETFAKCMAAKGYTGKPAGKGSGGAAEAVIDHSAVLFGAAAPQS